MTSHDDRRPFAARAARWYGPGLALAVVAATLTLLYVETAIDALETWQRTAAHAFSFLILPISAYFVWLRRNEVAALTPRPSPLAALLAVPAAALWLVGELAQAAVVAQFGMVALVQVAVLGALGWPIYRALLFPLQLLWFLVPAGESLLPAMIQLTIVLTKAGLTLLGLTVTVDGNILDSEAGRFAVVEACSALDFLIGNALISLVFANLMFNRLGKRALYVLAGLPVAVLANNLRTTAVIYVTYLTDGRYDLAADHETFGWLVFSGAVAVQMAVGWHFRDPAPAPAPLPPPAPPPRPGRTAAATAILLVPLLAAPALAAWLVAAPPPATPVVLCPPPGLGDSTVSTWRPPFRGADATLARQFDVDGTPVDLLAAFYSGIGPGHEMVTWRNRLDLIWEWRQLAVSSATVRIDGAPAAVTEFWLRGPARARRLAWRVYWVEGRLLTSDWQAKLMRVVSALQGKSNAAMLIVATPAPDGREAAAARLQTLLDRGPVLGLVLQVARSGAAC